MANIIFIDNFDSFTYNLVDQFRSLGHNVKVFRNTVELSVVEQQIEQEIDRNTKQMVRAPEQLDFYERDPINCQVDIWVSITLFVF